MKVHTPHEFKERLRRVVNGLVEKAVARFTPSLLSPEEMAAFGAHYRSDQMVLDGELASIGKVIDRELEDTLMEDGMLDSDVDDQQSPLGESVHLVSGDDPFAEDAPSPLIEEVENDVNALTDGPIPVIEFPDDDEVTQLPATGETAQIESLDIVEVNENENLLDGVSLLQHHRSTLVGSEHSYLSSSEFITIPVYQRSGNAFVAVTPLIVRRHW